MIWFTADYHIFHNNVIRYCERPFNNIKEMHRIIINNHNSIVSENDTVYNLGDFTMIKNVEGRIEKFLSNLNGIHHLIIGNHDRFKPFQYVNIGFSSVHTWLKVEEFNLTHDPAVSTVAHNEKWLCGHVHRLFKKTGDCLNVGVDIWNFFPVSISQVREEFSN